MTLGRKGRFNKGATRLPFARHNHRAPAMPGEDVPLVVGKDGGSSWVPIDDRRSTTLPFLSEDRHVVAQRKGYEKIVLQLLGPSVTLMVLVGSILAEEPQLPTNNNPARQIRFSDAKGADERRAQLIRFIWPDGLPTSLPTTHSVDQFPPQLSRALARVTAQIERLDVNIGGWDFYAHVLLLHPNRPLPTRRLVLIHQGHDSVLSFGLERAMQHLLESGLHVAIFHMPGFGWNTDRDGQLPDGTLFEFAGDDKLDHNLVFKVLADKVHGQTFRLFLEPVIQTINLWIDRYGLGSDVSMIGLSGGGWSTSMAAALDQRIKLSVPVAGSAPLYVRNQDVKSVGDTEQLFGPLYDEAIAEDGSGGGVATWLEIYTLGALGQGRRQCMISNQFDTCCFSGNFAETFHHYVTSAVQQCGPGRWEHLLDSVHQEHKLSGHMLNQIVSPAMGIPNWTGHNLPLVDRFPALQSPESILPAGWTFGPQHQGYIAYSTSEIVMLGRPTASMMALQSWDVQNIARFQCRVCLTEIAPHSEVGMLVLSGADPRPHAVGLLVNRHHGEIFVETMVDRTGKQPPHRLQIGSLDRYQGGPLQLMLGIGPDGLTAQIEGEAQWKSDPIAWSKIPGEFSPKLLGDAAMLCIRVNSDAMDTIQTHEPSSSRAMVAGASVELPTHGTENILCGQGK